MTTPPPLLDSVSKHTVTFSDAVHKALTKSAQLVDMEPNELIQELVLQRVIVDGTLDPIVQSQIENYRWLVDHAVAVAVSICRDDKFSPSITADTFEACTRDAEWARRYEAHVGDNIYKSGNPRKGPINRDIGFRIRRAIGAEIQKDEAGKPVLQKVLGQVIQSYTPFRSYDRSKF